MTPSTGPVPLVVPTAPDAAPAVLDVGAAAPPQGSPLPGPPPAGPPHTGAPGISWTGVAMVMGSCLSLQVGAAVAIGLFPHLGSWGVTVLRLGIAALLMLALVRPAVHRWSRAQWTAVLLLGVSFGGMNGTFYASLDRIPMGVAVAVEFLGPLVLAAVLARRRWDAACVAVAFAGIGLLGADSLLGATLDPVGMVLALVAGVFWAAYVVFSERVGRLVPGMGGLAVAMLVGALLITPLGAPGAAVAVVEPRLLGLAAVTALLSSVLPYSLELSALRRLPSGVFSILLSLEPAFAALCGWLMLGQVSGPLRLAAIALVIAASAGITLGGRRRAQAS